VKEKQPLSVADAIRAQAETMTAARSLRELRLMESIAGRAYWQVLARMPISYDGSWRGRLPDHWHVAGPRTSYLDKKRARLAQTPAHAVLNYLFAVLQTEATIAAHTLGLDPSIGIMHTDIRYRGSLAVDLMEPARPAADEIALELLGSHRFSRGEVFETRRGTCRLGPALAKTLARRSTELRRAVAPHAERLARTLLKAAEHPTPLTRRRHTQSRTARTAARHASREFLG
jgi:CRISPR/Cas system-associated endonuclease Cas1